MQKVNSGKPFSALAQPAPGRYLRRSPMPSSSLPLRSLMKIALLGSGPMSSAVAKPLAGLNLSLGYGARLGTGITPTWLRST